VDFGIDGAAAVRVRANERGGLANEAVALECAWIPGQRWIAAHDLSVLVHPPAFSVDHVDGGMGGEGAGDRAQRAGKIGVVRVEPG
jgi:hypothetical protein